MLPISEAVHNHEYKFLWDLLFERHPEGARFKGRFEESHQPFPSRHLLVEMFEKQPVVLILDEFQKWYDGLPEVYKGLKTRIYASNFIQILSEISVERPDTLIFIISVLNNDTEAYQQVHRDNPTEIHFHGPNAKKESSESRPSPTFSEPGEHSKIRYTEFRFSIYLGKI